MPALPLPVPDEDSLPFWEYCAQGELRAQKCRSCGTLRHPPRPMCAKCGSFDFGWQRLSGKGTVYSYIVSHQAIHPALDGLIPHAAVLVKLDEGPLLTSNLVDCPIDEIRIDLPVEVVFEKQTDETRLPKFRRT